MGEHRISESPYLEGKSEGSHSTSAICLTLALLNKENLAPVELTEHRPLIVAKGKNRHFNVLDKNCDFITQKNYCVSEPHGYPPTECLREIPKPIAGPLSINVTIELLIYIK